MGKKGLEKKIARLILVNLKDLEKRTKKSLLKMSEKEKEMVIKKFFKAIQEYSINKWDEYEPNEVLVYKKTKKLLRNYEKILQIREEEEQIKKEHEIQKNRKKF